MATAATQNSRCVRKVVPRTTHKRLGLSTLCFILLGICKAHFQSSKVTHQSASRNHDSLPSDEIKIITVLLFLVSVFGGTGGRFSSCCLQPRDAILQLQTVRPPPQARAAQITTEQTESGRRSGQKCSQRPPQNGPHFCCSEIVARLFQCRPHSLPLSALTFIVIRPVVSHFDFSQCPGTMLSQSTVGKQNGGRMPPHKPPRDGQ